MIALSHDLQKTTPTLSQMVTPRALSCEKSKTSTSRKLTSTYELERSKTKASPAITPQSRSHPSLLQKSLGTDSQKEKRKESAHSISPQSQRQDSASSLTSVLIELTGTINAVVSRLDKQDERMESIEKQLKSVSSSRSSVSSSSESGGGEKQKIPLVVRVRDKIH